MSTRYASVFAVLSICTLAHAVRAQEDTNEPECALAAVPARVAGLDLVSWQKFPTASAGSLFRYRATGRFAPDVYLYPPDTPLDTQMTSFKESLEVYQQRGEYESFEIEVERETAGLPSHPPGRYILAILRRGDESRRSHFYLFDLGSQHLKVRITHPEGQFTDEVLESFISELLSGMPT